MKFVCLLLTFSKFSCETLEDVFISLMESDYTIVRKCWKKCYIFSLYRNEFCSFVSEEISNVPPVVLIKDRKISVNLNFIPQFLGFVNRTEEFQNIPPEDSLQLGMIIPSYGRVNRQSGFSVKVPWKQSTNESLSSTVFHSRGYTTQWKWIEVEHL